MAVMSLIGSIVTGITSAIGAGVSALGGLSGLSAAAGVIGTGISAYGMIQQAEGNRRAEALRMRQMNLQAARERRSTVRQSVIARAQALSAATAQGAGQGSGILAGMGNVTSQAAGNVQGINQGQEIGQGMFAANALTSSGQTLASIGGAFRNFGNNLAQNQEVYQRAFKWS